MAQEVKEDPLDVVYDHKEHGSECEVFGTKGTNLTINGNEIKFSGQWSGYVDFVFGKELLIPSEVSRVEWTFRLNYFSGNYILFGICDTENNTPNQNYALGHWQGNFYMFYNGTKTSHNSKGSYQSFGQGYQSGDIIKMAVDFEKKQLTYYKNNTLIGVVFDDIKTKNVQGYRLAVGLSYNNEIVTLEQYSKSSDYSLTYELNKVGTLLSKAAEKSEKQYNKLETNKKDIKMSDLLKISNNIVLYHSKRKEISLLLNTLDENMIKIEKENKAHINPDASNYESWTVNDIIMWVISLDNGRFRKYCEKLKDSFVKNELKGGDLPDISRQDLDISFGIKSFSDRVALEKHLRGLQQNENEGGQSQVTNL